MAKVRIGIAGYGNLGKGVELAIRQNDDMELAGIFTRRDPSTVKPLTEGAKVYKLDDAENMKDAVNHISYYPYYEKLSEIITLAKREIEKAKRELADFKERSGLK